MTRRQLLVAAAMAFALATLTTWPVRSERLIGWDAANFAFALDKIDIASHRPHPPGYLGYVFVGRALRPFFADANAALTSWNVVVRAAAAVLVMLLTVSATGGSLTAGAAAAAILLCSPLLWFYASNAEIYPSEMALVLAVVYACAEVLKGRRRAVYWVAGLLATTAMFKVSAAIMIGPAALFAWSRAESRDRIRSALLFGVLAGSIFGLFYAIQPNFLDLLWAQFSGATGPSRLGGTTSNLGRTLNRNARDTFGALVATVGILNAVGFVAWAVLNRRLPGAIDRRLVVLWAAPWLVLLLFVHIGNPGYVLPLLPLACLILGAWYARRPAVALTTIMLLQALISIVHVGWFSPPLAADDQRYADKTIVQRLASDLAVLTFPTVANVRRSDETIDQLISVASGCTSGTWVVVAELEPLDWRRTSYYLPRATSIKVKPDGQLEHISHGAEYSLVDHDIPIGSPCGLLWMTTRKSSEGLPQDGRQLSGLGWVFPPGAGTASPAGITWLQGQTAH